jgi:hypothetical protein
MVAADRQEWRAVTTTRASRLAWALCALAVLGLALSGWFDHPIREAGRPDLAHWGALDAIYAVLGLGSPALVGAVVASRRPGHPVGWLLLAYGVLVTASLVAGGYLAYALLARPGALPGAAVAVVVVLRPQRLRRPSPAAGPGRAADADRGPAVAPLAVAGPRPRGHRGGQPGRRCLQPAAAGAAPAVGHQPPALTIVAAAVSLVVRFRRARGVERQQLRWVAFVAAMVPVAVLVGVTASLIGGPAADPVVTFVAGTISWLVPFALGAAALRYRLYDLDRIISRTLAYGLLTVLLGLGYAAVVLGLGRLLPEASSLAVAAATLAVAALFQPLRRRVQGLVDRRFNRRRYDAGRTVDAFSARLRDQLDLDALHGELLAVVDQTVQPTRASLWLRR